MRSPNRFARPALAIGLTLSLAGAACGREQTPEERAAEDRAAQVADYKRELGGAALAIGNAVAFHTGDDQQTKFKISETGTLGYVQVETPPTKRNYPPILTIYMHQNQAGLQGDEVDSITAITRTGCKDNKKSYLDKCRREERTTIARPYSGFNHGNDKTAWSGSQEVTTWNADGDQTGRTYTITATSPLPHGATVSQTGDDIAAAMLQHFTAITGLTTTP
jgi:hypothetical protein